MKKKRILFTIPNFDTAGSGKALLKVALGLNSNLFEPNIACLHDRGAFFKTVKASGIPVHIFPFVSPARPISKLFKSSWAVSKQFKAIGADLIHSYHYSSDYTEAFAAKLTGIPWVFTKKNMSWGGKSKNAWKLRSYLAKGIAIQNTDMQKQFYQTSNKTYLIPRGVDSTQFRPASPDPKIKQSIDTKGKDRIIICVANMVPVKGIELLIQAFKNLSVQYPDWVLWLVGDDKHDYGRLLHQIVIDQHLESKVYFSGKVKRVVDYLNQAEIFVLPTKDEGRREGSPVALLEAMANGKVVIGSAIPGIKDQLNGFQDHLFIPGDINSLTQKLVPFLSQSSEDNKAVGLQFSDLAADQFSIQTEIKNHELMYKTILKM